jgi:hypothetical protein
VVARVASPAVKRIVATRGIALVFRYNMLWFLSKFKKVICPVIIFRLESTIDGEIWHLKSSHTEFSRFQSIL